MVSRKILFKDARSENYCQRLEVTAHDGVQDEEGLKEAGCTSDL